MSKPLKSLRTNMMYWRFRYITRNRLRLQSWWNRRRQPKRVAPAVYRTRGAASQVRYRTARRTWIAVLLMVSLLTALKVISDYNAVNSYLNFGLTWGIIIACMYWALMGV
jgi:hypothetical protein